MRLNIIAMARSGHNAVGWYLFQNCSPPKIYLNGVSMLAKPFRGDNPFSAANWMIYQEDQGPPPANRTSPGVINCAKHPDTAAALGKRHWHSVLCDYEDLEDPTALDPGAHLLVLRDPLNLFASRIKQGFTNEDNYDAHVRIWKQHIGWWRIYPTRTIFYNRFACEDNYRLQVLQSLNLACLKPDFSYIPFFGGGSSFDGLKYQGRAWDMDVLNRWKRPPAGLFRRVLCDYELLTLAADLFGICHKVIL